MKTPLMILSSLLLLAACGEPESQQHTAASTPKPTPAKPLCEIDENSIAGIPLGTTLTEVKQVMPNAIITPLKDKNGMTFSSIKVSPEIEVFVYTEENDNPDSPISYLNTRSAVCDTAQGVRPNMLVRDAEKIYGIVEQVVLSEPNGEQTAEFVTQAPELSFLIDGTGIFDDRDRVYPKISTAYHDKAKIEAIAVMGLPEEDDFPEELAESASAVQWIIYKNL